jgi:DNA primase
MAHFSEGLLDQIRDANDIVDLISEYLPLKKRGKNFLGLCPFHTEKDPSFTVTPDKQIFYCFGCGEGGNVISFLMKHEKLSFPEAVKLLAKRASIPLPKDSFDERKEKQLDALYYANQVANEYFVKNLNDEKTGKRARKYLDKRGFEPKTQKLFSLGYAPDEWEGLIRYARTKGMETETLNQAGLVVPRADKPGHYDRFRNRITFSIYNLSGKVVGFGSRVLDDKDTPKYLNSPETPIYQKGKVLYGLNLSKDAIRQKAAAILVEGNVDLITLYQAGITNVVAASGTAFTSDQARLLSRYAEKVYLFFDADSAGQSATLRSVDLLFSEGVEVLVVTLEQGQDPDSFLRQKGMDVVKARIENAVPFIEFKRQSLSKDFRELSIREQEKVIGDLAETAGKISDEIRRNLFVKKVSQVFGMEEAAIVKLVEKKRPSTVRRPQSTASTAIGKPPTLLTPEEKIERGILKILMEDRALLKLTEDRLKLEDFSSPQHRGFFQQICTDRKVTLASMMDKEFGESTTELILHLAKLDLGPADLSVQLDDHLTKLEGFKEDRRRKSLKDEIAKAEQKGDKPTADRLTKELFKRLKKKQPKPRQTD